AAYLAYADPVRFRSDRILIVVPNEALRHYVGHVLPTLGVGDVKVATFARIAAEVLPTILPKVPERISDDTPPLVSRAKEHPAMLKAMVAARDRVLANIEGRLQKTMAKWPEGERVVHAFAATKELGAPDIRVSTLSQWTHGRRKLEGIEEARTLPDVTRHALEKLVADLHHVA